MLLLIYEYKVSGPLFPDSVATSPDQPLIIPNFTVLALRPRPSAMRTCLAAAIVQGLVLNAAASGPPVDIDAGTLHGRLCTNHPHAPSHPSATFDLRLRSHTRRDIRVVHVILPPHLQHVSSLTPSLRFTRTIRRTGRLDLVP